MHEITAVKSFLKWGSRNPWKPPLLGYFINRGSEGKFIVKQLIDYECRDIISL